MRAADIFADGIDIESSKEKGGITRKYNIITQNYNGCASRTFSLVNAC